MHDALHTPTEADFGPGELVPSSRDLCEQWGVSRATVIKAMDTLRNDGVVVARQGAGFTVVETPVARPAGRRTGPRISGGYPFKRLSVPTEEAPPERVRDSLQLPRDARALRRDRIVMLAEGEAYTLVSAWFPPDITEACPRLAQNGPIAEGTTRHVTRETGRRPVSATDIYTVRLATAYECERLGVTQPAAVAVTLHTAHDMDGSPLVCEEGVTAGQLWELSETYSMES